MSSPDARRPLLAGLALVVLALVAHLPSVRLGFVWDDDDYVTENETLDSLAGLGRIWSEPTSIPQYYPLVHTSYWLEHHLWGERPAGYHATNAFLHAAAALLAWLVLRRLRVPGAWLAAALFAVHPVQVESVAWITERKNVLSGALYFGAALAWLRFALPERATGQPLESAPGDERSGGRRDWRAWGLALALFAAALLAKTTAATFPAAALLVLWWKRGRIGLRRDVLPLVPFFALGIGLGLLTAHLERTHVGAHGPDFELGLPRRLAIAGRVPWFYLGKLAWPHPLSFVYERWAIDPATLGAWLPLAGALLVLAALWALRGVLGRGPLSALLFFGGTLLPASGLFDVYPMRFSFVADHFQYLACLGPLALAAALATRALPRALLLGASALVLNALVALTWSRQGDFVDQDTLWTRTLERNPRAWIAHDNLAYSAQRAGLDDVALGHFAAAAELRPADPNAWNTLASARFHAGDLSRARADWERALALDPRFALAERNLGLLEEREGRVDAARARYAHALELAPADPVGAVLLGHLELRAGREAEAEAAYRRALALEPAALREATDAALYLALLLERRGARDEARALLARVLAARPGDAQALAGLQRLGAGSDGAQPAPGSPEAPGAPAAPGSER